MASRAVNFARRVWRAAGRLVGIGGRQGPQGVLGGVYTSAAGTAPNLNTKALLEGFDTMPWLRAVADKVGTAVGGLDWRLYAVGKPPKPEAAVPVPDAFVYTLSAADLAQMVGEVVGRELAGRVRRIKGQLEPWAQRDRRAQRAPAEPRWKHLEGLRRAGLLQEVSEHPFYDALENPNPFMGRTGLMKLTEISFDLVGDAFWLKDRNGAGAPVGFWPIPAHWITETPTPGTPFFRASWSGWQRMIPESEVVWFHEPSPAHPFARGSGVGFALGDELEVDEYLAKMTKQLFFNQAKPDWIFAGGEGTSETEMRRLERDVLQRHQGFWRQSKPWFLTGGGDDINKRIHEFQRPTMEQLVYPGLRKTQRDVVLQTWGAPPELFGITENSNRATVQAAEYLFTKWVVLPRGERMRVIIQAKVLPDYDDRLLLDYTSPVEEDKEHDLNVRKAAPWAWDADEWRHAAGDGPMEGEAGKVFLVPLNSFITDDLLDAEQRPHAAAPPPGPDPAADEAAKEPKPAVKPPKESPKE